MKVKLCVCILAFYLYGPNTFLGNADYYYYNYNIYLFVTLHT